MKGIEFVHPSEASSNSFKAQQAAMTLKLCNSSLRRPMPSAEGRCILRLPISRQAILSASESPDSILESWLPLRIMDTVQRAIRSNSSLSRIDPSRCRRVCEPVLLNMVPVKTSISVSSFVAWSEYSSAALEMASSYLSKSYQ
jgi:hypothetical protein